MAFNLLVIEEVVPIPVTRLRMECIVTIRCIISQYYCREYIGELIMQIPECIFYIYYHALIRHLLLSGTCSVFLWWYLYGYDFLFM
jgi:hypothetical protein